MIEEPRVQLEKLILELQQRNITADFKADISYDNILYSITECIKRRQEAETTKDIYDFAKKLYDKTVK